MESEPPKTKILDEDKTEELMKFYSHRQLGWSQAGDNKYFLPYGYPEHAESIWKLCCPYWSHVKEAWSLRHHPNLLFLFYEEMKMDLAGVIRKASEFYGRPCTDNEVAKLEEHLNMDNFKKNPMIGSRDRDGCEFISKTNFVRKGEVGGWKELFTPELEAQVDKWIEKNLRDTDLVFPYVQLTSSVEQ